MSKKKKIFLGIVVLFAIFLLFLSFGIIRQHNGKPSGSLAIYNIIISTELNDWLRLTGTISRFPHGSRQVWLRFDYSQFMEDGNVEILWFLGEELVQSGSYALSGTSGSKTYCLTRENKQLLPKGLYSVAIVSDEERSDFIFEIY